MLWLTLTTGLGWMTPNYFYQLQSYRSHPSLCSILPFSSRCLYHLLHLLFCICHFFHFAILPQERNWQTFPFLLFPHPLWWVLTFLSISIFYLFPICLYPSIYKGIGTILNHHSTLANTLFSRDFSCYECSLGLHKHFGIQNQISSKQPHKVLPATTLLHTKIS